MSARKTAPRSVATHSVNGTAPATPQDMALTGIERSIIDQIVARKREIEQATVAVQQEVQTAIALIEQRLGLDARAIGTTHGIQDGAVVPLPTPESADGALLHTDERM